MNGVTIILVSDEPTRARAALTIALGVAAMGGRARFYAHEQAVALLAAAQPTELNAQSLAQSGLPDLPELLAMSSAAGVELWACQTGLAMTRLAMAALTPGAQAGGLIGLMATLGDDRLLTL